VHASWQQKPSTQLPEAHCAASVHACPFAERQLPTVSHAWAPEHGGVEFTSGPPLARMLHVPLALAHE
jgi:hypothetical protein